MSSLKCWLRKVNKQDKISKEDLNEIMARLDGHDKAIRYEERRKTIEEIIIALTQSEDTILSDRQYYELLKMKEGAEE